MIIITQDTTQDQWLQHHIYDTETGIRYSFEVAETDKFVPQYDATAQPIRLIVEHAGQVQAENQKPTLVYKGLEAIEFLRQFGKQAAITGRIYTIAHMALKRHEEYYRKLDNEHMQRLLNWEDA